MTEENDETDDRTVSGSIFEPSSSSLDSSSSETNSSDSDHSSQSTEPSDRERESTAEKIREQKRRAYPDVGYQVLMWDLLKPPKQRLQPLKHTNRLKLSEMSPRHSTGMTEYGIRDSEGRTYTDSDFETIPDNPKPEAIDDVCSTIESEDGKQRRLALAHLAAIATEHPDAATDAVPTVTAQLGEAPPAVQGEAIRILKHIASVDPVAVNSAVPPVAELLTTDTEPMLLTEALEFVAVLASSDPDAVLDVVPQLTVLLGTDDIDAKPIVNTFASLSKDHPEELVSVVPKLESFLEDGDDELDVGVLAALGRVAKSYPSLGKEAIPAATSVLEAEDKRRRANAAGLLTDIAEEYPDELQSVVPQAIELLEDDDERVRYNATSLLARVADEHPEAVEPATEALVACLDDEMSDTRFNVCWALIYIEADETVPELVELAENDPDEDVRAVARTAIERLEG